MDSKAAEITAYQRAFGGSRALAEDRLEIQHRAENLVGRLKEALGDDFAGVWFDPATGQYVVPAVAGANRAAVAAVLGGMRLGEHYRIAPARSSWQGLIEAQERLDGALSGRLEPQMVSTWLDPEFNAVMVDIAAAATEADVAEIKRAANALDVETRVSESRDERFGMKALACGSAFLYRYCDKPLRGGVGIQKHDPEEIVGPLRECTLAFRARGDTNGKRYALTAGHCVQFPGEDPTPLWDSANELQKPIYIGAVEQHVFPTHDWAKIDATSSDWDTASWPARVVWWGENQANIVHENYSIDGEEWSEKNDVVCHSGSSTGTSCGTVQALHKTEAMTDEDGKLLGSVENMTLVDGGCIYGGDSGGPVFAEHQALGIFSGGEWPIASKPCYEAEWVYGEIKEATNALNVHIAPLDRLPSQTTISVTNRECPKQSQQIGGTVKSGSTPIEANVDIYLYRWEGNQWVYNKTVQTAVDKGAYQSAEMNLASGKWRAKTVFSATEFFSWSESAYQEFTVLSRPPSLGADEDDAAPGPRAVVQCNGTIDVFYRTPSGALGHQWYVKGGAWAQADLPGSLAPSAVPHAVRQDNGTVDVFYRTNGDGLGHNWYDPGSGWKSGDLPGSVGSDPHPVVQSDGTIDVFFRTPSSALGHTWYDPGSGWFSANLSGSGAMNSDPHPVAQGNGTVDVFFRNPTDGLGHHWYDPTVPNSAWKSGDLPGSVGSDPFPVVRQDGTIDVFFRTPSSALGHSWYAPGGTWTSANLSGSGAVRSDPHPLAQHSGTVDVFFRNPTDGLGHHWYDPGSGWKSGDLPGSVGSDPHPVVQPDGSIDVFFRTPSGALGHSWYGAGGTWTSANLTGTLSSQPHAVAQADGTIDVFYRTSTGAFGHNWYSKGGSWVEAPRPGPIASRPPVVGAESTANLGETQATVNASINPEGSPVSYSIEYGPTTSYGSKKTASLDPGTYPVNVSQTLTGLTANMTYHYRVVASGAEGTTTGPDRTFTTGIAGKLGAMTLTEPFNGSTASLANFSANFGVLGWVSGKGEDTTSGWRSTALFPSFEGTYYLPTVADAGNGAAAVATVASSPNNYERYVSIWLDIPTPGSPSRAGYELRFMNLFNTSYDVTLSKWQAGTQNVLASKPSYTLPTGGSVALVDKGSTVSVWTNSGAGFSQLLSAVDGAFSAGNAGLSAAGSGSRLINFKAGALG